MPLEQYVYFALSSKHTTASEMAAFLGIEPDETKVRGIRRTTPVVIPSRHRWKIVCREPGLRVDEQITNILDRLRPHTERIADLGRRLATEEQSGRSAITLQVVRYFNDDDAATADDAASDDGPPNLFGWHLDRDVLEFLMATGADLDVDEYDMTPQPAVTEDGTPG